MLPASKASAGYLFLHFLFPLQIYIFANKISRFIPRKFVGQSMCNIIKNILNVSPTLVIISVLVINIIVIRVKIYIVTAVSYSLSVKLSQGASKAAVEE